MLPFTEETLSLNDDGDSDDGDSLSKSGYAIDDKTIGLGTDGVLETLAVDDEIETQVVSDDDGDARILGDGVDSYALTYDEGISKGDAMDVDSDRKQGSMVPLDEGLAVETKRDVGDFLLCRETQVVDGDELIETQVVDDDEGITGSEVDGDDNGTRVFRDEVDFNNLMNDEGRSKGHVRSFAAVRTASLRASGLAAAQRNLPKAVDVELRALSNNGSVRSFAAIHAASLRASGLAAARRNTSKGFNVELSFLFNNGESYNNEDNRLGEITRVHETGNSKKCTLDYYRDESNSRANNQVAKKLLYDMESDEEESTRLPNNNIGDLDSPSSLASDNIAGLTYIVSQEPGDLSQANALDVVDKFLVVNDLGLSQEGNVEKSTDFVKSPPTSSAKGVQILAKKTGHKSLVGKIGTFEWIDNLEDEGGGEFFTRRKDSFFGREERISLSLPPIVPIAVLENEDCKQKKYSNLTNFTHLGSRFMQYSSIMNEKALVAETRARKNLFKDINEQSNSKSLQQLKATDADRGEESICEFGPDTQMTAEAMDTLIHELPIPSRAASSRKSASSTPNVEGVSTRSKKRKMLYTDLKQETHVTSISNSRGQNSLECTTKKAKSRRGKKDLGQSLDAKSSASEAKCCLSLKGEKALRQMDKASTRWVQPVAHRTRHSKAVGLSEKNENIAGDYGEDIKMMTNVRIHGKITRKCSDVDSVRNAEVERTSHLEAQDNECLDEEAAKSGSPVKDVLTRSKRRITRQAAQKFPSTLDDNTQHRTQERKITSTIKSVFETRDTGKRKRRSVCTSMVSGVRTRSSSKSSSLMPNVENALMSCSNEMVNPCSTPLLKQCVDFNDQVEVAEENAKTKKSLNERLQSPSVKDVDAVSPVCVAQDYKSTSGNESRRRSLISRELMQLETSTSSPSTTFNTRRRKDMANVSVLFSRHLDNDIVKQQKKVMGHLGIQLASSISDATHFVTDNFVRTRNMLEAMAMGKPVVTHMWLENCGQASSFIDEKNYILRDDKKEIEIGFSMPVSLAHACQNPLLHGKRVYITPNIQPSREVISCLVKAAHGQPIERIGRSIMKDDKIPDDLLVLSCEEDYSICIRFLEKGAEIFRSELLLNGIVIQKLEFQRHKLFLDHVKRTRSTIWLKQGHGNKFLPVT